MSMQLIVFAIGIGLAALGALLGLWRWERGRRREALAKLDATQTELTIARGTLAARTEEHTRFMRASRRVDARRERAEDRILSAPDADDGPMSPVLAETLERHRARQEANAASNHSVNSGGFDSTSDAGGVSDGGAL